MLWIDILIVIGVLLFIKNIKFPSINTDDRIIDNFLVAGLIAAATLGGLVKGVLPIWLTVILTLIILISVILGCIELNNRNND